MRTKDEHTGLPDDYVTPPQVCLRREGACFTGSGRTSYSAVRPYRFRTAGDTAKREAGILRSSELGLVILAVGRTAGEYAAWFLPDHGPWRECPQHQSCSCRQSLLSAVPRISRISRPQQEITSESF